MLRETTTNYLGTYEYREYRIDTIKTEESYEAWLYRENYTVKMFMFGDCYKENGTTYEEFLEYVENEIEDYIEEYQNEYEND